jgi:predicted MFS family arabinose efflux permease
VPAPFRVRSFRFQWPADLATSWAFEMETIALGWYVLVETGSVLWLAAFGSLQFGGTLIAPMFGVVGDRIGHRNLLCVMRGTYAVLALMLTAFAVAGALTPVVVFIIYGLSGLVRPSDLVMRNALVGETMVSQHLMSAMGISRSTADSARVVGALTGAGLVTALGIAAAYAVIVGFYVLSLALTFGIASARPGTFASETVGVPASHWGDLRDSLAYIWNMPQLLAAMCLACLVNLTAFPFANGLLPYMARDIYHLNQTGLGYLVASFASGALVGSISLSMFGGALAPGRMMIVFCAGWYIALMFLAQAESAGTGFVLLMAAGFFQSLGMVILAVLLVRNSDARFRGRVMGVRMLAVYSLPIGLLASGPLIERFGLKATMTAYCLVGLSLTALIAWHWRAHIWRAEAPGNKLSH